MTLFLWIFLEKQTKDSKKLMEKSHITNTGQHSVYNYCFPKPFISYIITDV